MIDWVRRWLLLAVVVAAAVVVAMTPSTTTASTAAFAYDIPSIARNDAHGIGADGAGPAQFSGWRAEPAPPSAHGRGTSTTPALAVVATEAATGASNAATAPALARQLAGEEASSIFTSSGGLQQSVIDASREIIPGTDLSNGQLIKTLTADGSSIADWGKFSTPTFNSPSGPFQVHFYMNPSTGVVHYLDDFKVVFNRAR